MNRHELHQAVLGCTWLPLVAQGCIRPFLSSLSLAIPSFSKLFQAFLGFLRFFLAFLSVISCYPACLFLAISLCPVP